MDVDELLEENRRRRERQRARFDPVSGEGAPGERREVRVEGMTDIDGRTPAPALMWLPRTLCEEPMARRLTAAGSMDRYIKEATGRRPTIALRQQTAMEWERLRCRHDFAYWAARHAHIKPKGGGPDVTLRLNAAQRRLTAALEGMRTAGKPIRLVLLKARQWGGSTCVQLYMAWLQLLHSEGLNSLIIAHQGAATEEIRDMLDRMIEGYPEHMLTRPGKRLATVGRSGASVRLTEGNCKVKVGSAERPNSCRGGDYNLVHLSEVGMWRKTSGKSPEELVRSACSGVLYEPLTMIVYESTANGVGNFFHREYQAAARGESQFEALFVSWHEIEQYRLAPDDDRRMAERLIAMRGQDSAPSEREQPGRYLWWLWEQGATLDAINWYVAERAKYSDQGQMAAEYPTNDVEAFANSGGVVFDRYKAEALRAGCRAPLAQGELTAKGEWGPRALEDVRFSATEAGALKVWAWPDTERREIHNRYMVVVDIGGRTAKADWSVVAVMDRAPTLHGAGPEVVAQWRGHCDIDLLAWKAARTARWYLNALLVVESNTLETRDSERWVDGDQSGFILNQIRDVYPNLYMRRRNPEDIAVGRPVKYGFHTNVYTKPMIISGLVRAVRDGLYTERCHEAVDELLTYERRPNGSYGAIAGYHDDILMTRAIGLHVSEREMRPVSIGHRAVTGRHPPESVMTEAWIL